MLNIETISKPVTPSMALLFHGTNFLTSKMAVVQERNGQSREEAVIQVGLHDTRFWEFNFLHQSMSTKV